MRTLVAVACVTVTAALVPVRDSAAQDLIVSNARIVDGKGGVIERGSVVVRDGKIVSVSSGAPARVSGAQTIDAQGRTLMPGFIDAHRHIAQGDPAEWLAKRAAPQMQEFLDAGFTTVLCAICPDQAIELRQRIESGAVKGPRLYLGSIIPLARAGAPGPAGAGRGGGRGGDPARFDNSRPPLRPTVAAEGIPASRDDQGRRGSGEQEVRLHQDSHYHDARRTGDGHAEADRVRRQEAQSADDHTRRLVIDTLAACRGSPGRARAHASHRRARGGCGCREADCGRRNPDDVNAGGFVPHFSGDNAPLFRDAMPFPWKTIASAGQGPVNARLLWEAGISYGDGTDTSWPPKDGSRTNCARCASCSRGATSARSSGQGAAHSTLKQDQIGTLEPGQACGYGAD